MPPPPPEPPAAEGRDPASLSGDPLRVYFEALRAGALGELALLREERAELAGDFDALDAAWKRVAPLLSSGRSIAHDLRSRFGVEGGVSLHGSPTTDDESARPHAESSSRKQPASRDSSNHRGADPAADSDDLIERIAVTGAVFGRYHRPQEIARGGMGSIQRVWDADLRRYLVMKVMLSSKDRNPAAATRPPDQRLIGRFLEEAQLTGQLDHPGILPVHDIGIDPEGRLYFTMPLVKGQELGRVIDLERDGDDEWTRARLLSALNKAMEAVAYAHSRGVVHRDLKPENIMVGRFGETYVMDWGLARVLTEATRQAREAEDAADDKPSKEPQSGVFTERSDESTSDPHSPLVTLDGDVIGTPGYMAPEQAHGNRAAIGPHSDVYAMGAILYQMVTGCKPFDDPVSRASGTPLIQRILEEEPQPIAALSSDVPQELTAICEKAMARDPGERYGSMVEMNEDLRAYLEGRVVTAYETGVLAEFRKWLNRNKLAAAAIALLLLGGLASAGLFVVQQQNSLEDLAAEQIETEKQRKEAERQLGLANKARDDAEEQRARTEEALGEARQQKEIADKRLDKSREYLEAADLARRDAKSATKDAEYSSYSANLLAAELSLASNDLAEARRRLDACPENLRGWEWKHLRLRADTSLSAWEGHAGAVVASAVDANFVVSVGNDLQLKIWSRTSGRELASFPSPSPGAIEPFSAVDVSPRRSLIATGRRDGRVHLFDRTRGLLGEVWAPELESGTPVLDLAFSPEGDWLAVALEDVRLHSTQVLLFETNGMSVSSRTIGAGDATRLAWDPRGRRLGIGFEDGSIKIIDVLANAAPLELELHRNPITALAFSNDGRRLAAAAESEDETHLIVVADAEAGGFIGRLVGHDDVVAALGFTADGRWIVSGGRDRTVRLWDIDSAGDQLRATLRGHVGAINDVALLGPEGPILTSSEDGTLRVWELYSGESVSVIPNAGTPVAGAHVEFDADGDRLLAWSPRPTTEVNQRAAPARLYDARSLNLLGEVGDTMPPVDAPGFGPIADSVTAAATRGPRAWEVGDTWRAAGGSLLPYTTLLASRSADGSRFATIATPTNVSPASRQERDEQFLLTFRAQPDPKSGWRHTHESKVALPASRALAMRLLPDQQRVAIAHADGVVRIWNTSDASLDRALLTPEMRDVFGVEFAQALVVALNRRLLNGVWSSVPVVAHRIALGPNQLAVSRAGDWLAAAGENGHIYLWSLTDEDFERVFEGHDGAVSDLCFSALGNRLASCSTDGSIRIWDTARGLKLLMLRDSVDSFVALNFDPLGERLCAYASDGSLRIFESNPKATDVLARQRVVEQRAPGVLDSNSLGQRLLKQARDLGIVDENETASMLVDTIELLSSVGDERTLPGQIKRLGEDALERLRNPARLHDLAWRAVAQPDLDDDEYEAALERAGDAVDLSPGESLYLRTLGIAHFRLGDDDAAIETLQRAVDESDRAARPEELAVLAMAELRRGERDSAQQYFYELQVLLGDPYWARDMYAQSFLAEASDAFQELNAAGHLAD